MGKNFLSPILEYPLPKRTKFKKMCFGLFYFSNSGQNGNFSLNNLSVIRHSLWLWSQSPALQRGPGSDTGQWAGATGLAPGQHTAHSLAPGFLLQSVLPGTHKGICPPGPQGQLLCLPQHTPNLISPSTSWPCHPFLLSRFAGPHQEAPSSFLPDMSAFIFLGWIAFDNLLPIFLSSLGLAVLISVLSGVSNTNHLQVSLAYCLPLSFRSLMKMRSETPILMAPTSCPPLHPALLESLSFLVWQGQNQTNLHQSLVMLWSVACPVIL